MLLEVLDSSFRSVDIIDTFRSLIWNIRYCAYGDFELFMSMDESLFKLLRSNKYLWLKESNRIMEVESLKIEVDVEDGEFLMVTGRTLEAILTRRIVWNQTTLTGNLQNGIKKLLDENIIAPTDPKRKISNFIFEASTDTRITALTVDAQYHGDELYSVIQKLCADEDIGFEITLSSTGMFIFRLTVGENRSYDQVKNPYVEFSSEFENIINSTYLESTMEHKNVVLVGGEGEGSSKKTKAVGDVSGLARREIFVEAGSISSKVNGQTITDAVYLEHLNNEGKKTLTEKKIIKLFDGEVDFINTFIFGRDFFMGDTIQYKNKYDMEYKSKITEIIYSEDESGINIYPTFKILD